MKLLFDDGDEHVGGHGAPDLRLDRVFARAEKFFDAQVLLDPFEEQFDLPSLLVKGCDGQRRQDRIVGQEDQRLASVGVLEANSPQVLRIVLRNIETVHGDRLVAYHAGQAIDCGRVAAPGVHVAFGPGDEERAGLMHFVQPGEVQITAIHDVEGPRFDWQEVQYIDLVHLAVADMDECRNGTAQIQQRMHLDGGLGRAKRRPVEQRQAQIDRRGVECIDRIGQIQTKICIAVKFASATDKYGCQVAPNAPIPRFVGIASVAR